MPIKWGKIRVTKKMEYAARQVAGGTHLIGEAAKWAGVTPIELMAFLSEAGYRSPYSWEDFLSGTEELDRFLDYSPPKR